MDGGRAQSIRPSSNPPPRTRHVHPLILLRVDEDPHYCRLAHRPAASFWATAKPVADRSRPSAHRHDRAVVGISGRTLRCGLSPEFKWDTPSKRQARTWRSCSRRRLVAWCRSTSRCHPRCWASAMSWSSRSSPARGRGLYSLVVRALGPQAAARRLHRLSLSAASPRGAR